MIKTVRNGMVGVLVSRGFGAGWSTWNREVPELLFDSYIVTVLADAGNEPTDQQMDSIKAYCAIKYPDIYAGGLEGLSVEWVPEGARFRIDEYDGSESLVLESNEEWMVA